jgi:hypothetical protein
MWPRYVYKDVLDNTAIPITCVSMNHENQLEQLKQMGPCSLHSRIEVDMQKYSFTHWEVLGMVAMP